MMHDALQSQQGISEIKSQVPLLVEPAFKVKSSFVEI